VTRSTAEPSFTTSIPPLVLAAAALVIAWALWLPLADVLRFPDRISVLPNLEADAAAYDAFARDLAGSWRLAALPAKHPPGWMAMLASVYLVAGHSYVAGKLLSWSALLVTVALCAWLAQRIWGREAALVAAVLCASSPGLRGYVGTLQYEVVTGALFTLLLVLSTRACEATGAGLAARRAALAGAAGARRSCSSYLLSRIGSGGAFDSRSIRVRRSSPLGCCSRFPPCPRWCGRPRKRCITNV
jgi:hypothetical protein